MACIYIFTTLKQGANPVILSPRYCSTSSSLLYACVSALFHANYKQETWSHQHRTVFSEFGMSSLIVIQVKAHGMYFQIHLNFKAKPSVCAPSPFSDFGSDRGSAVPTQAYDAKLSNLFST